MSSCGKGGVENRRAIGASWPVNKLIIPPGEEEEGIYIYIYAVSIPSSTTIYDDSPWYLSRLICRDENLPRHRPFFLLSSLLIRNQRF